MNRRWMIYGATGYTGQLIAQEAKVRGHTPVLAGRDRAAIADLARRLDLPHVAFALTDQAAVNAALTDFAAVLHCAGPFVHTSRPMVRAALHSGASYLDITGEIPVFEAIMTLKEEARQQGVVLLPGVGFDVVPTDCLAAMLAEALPSATELSLAFYARGGGISPGTLKTMIENFPAAGAIRKEGKIIRVPLAWDVRELPFSCGPRWAMTIPWGDVSTAFHTTGIPSIRVYSATPRRKIKLMRAVRPLLPLLSGRPAKRLLQRLASRRTGPGNHEQEHGRMFLWGSASDPSGAEVSMTMETPEGYRFTALSAVRSMERVLRGDVAPGSWTPARAFGSGFAAEIPGVVVHPPKRKEPL